MTPITKQLLLGFYRQNKRKPESIVMFRDGVGEGHFDIVMNEEGIAVFKWIDICPFVPNTKYGLTSSSKGSLTVRTMIKNNNKIVSISSLYLLSRPPYIR